MSKDVFEGGYSNVISTLSVAVAVKTRRAMFHKKTF